MATTPYSLSKNSPASQHKVYRSLEIDLSQPSFLSNTISIIDHPFCDSRNSENQPSVSSPEDSQSLNTKQAKTHVAKKSEKKQGHVPFPFFSSPNQAATPKCRNRSIATPRLFPSSRRNPTLMRDRFIPPRSYSGSTIAKYHMRKLPMELTADEKLLRQRERNEDPFGRRRNRKAIPAITQDTIQAPHISPHIVDSHAILSHYPFSGPRITPRQVSVGAVWNVGGASTATRGPWLGITDGQKGYSGSKSTAPMYFARYEFSQDISESEELEMNQARLAAAFDMDLNHRQLVICKPAAQTGTLLFQSDPQFDKFRPLRWKDCAWKRAEFIPDTRARRKQSTKAAAVPFSAVYAPYIKDDFYSSVIAYCCTSGLLAYAMMNFVCLWSSITCKTVAVFPLGHPIGDQVTALDFSSADGKNSILAVATSHGYLHLWETLKSRPLHSSRRRHPLTCVAFKATTTRQKSTISSTIDVSLEHLAVGDTRDPIPRARSSSIFGSWLAQLFRRRSHFDSTYSLSISRLSSDSLSDTSSMSGESGNDQAPRTYPRVRNRGLDLSNSSRPANISGSRPLRRVVSANYSPRLGYPESAIYLPRGSHVHRFEHGSAVKAVAFAPWQPTLLATGGGLGDRTVHFYHAPSGSCLAKIYMWAQITGLIWSRTRREIAVVLGFPEFEYQHPFRVVVFAWPSCEQVTAIPWNVGLDGQTYPDVYVVGRALSAISIPNFRNPFFEDEGECDFNPDDECIAIASSDFIRFYRIWGNPHKQFTGSIGVMKSAILESIDGIENPGNEVIR
ncbi:hypothetical protein UA08_04777 [Talaromyces atroroseus]|uniref:Anaphase-promoting complex subunit 4 WD40 domain-containing protein n=1 Tax=Talaromyces atroroseus TaxID=1441469 RepID=A0A225AZU2_TALAT|nr:hypothetical protein UA08_04777 [Talaromyces atroroseus]OKL59995.1 hypothetical protein UA08_04777 [Talaromyces atroroseus]